MPEHFKNMFNDINNTIQIQSQKYIDDTLLIYQTLIASVNELQLSIKNTNEKKRKD